MLIKIKGLKAWIAIIIFLVIVFAILAIIFHIVLFLIPLILIIIGISYLFRMLNKIKKEKPKDYIDVPYKIKK